MEDIDNLGIEKVAEIAFETAWKGCKTVYLSLDIDVLDCAFFPGTGTPGFGGMLPRELFRLLRLVTKDCSLPVRFHLKFVMGKRPLI